MNIRVNLQKYIYDGMEVVFRSPVDCSQVTGLKVYYIEDGHTSSMEFNFADAHGNNVGDIDHLFAENAVVKVILDVTTGMAFVQNADTNAYIERTFVKTVNGIKPDKNGNVDVAQGPTLSDNGIVISLNDASDFNLKGLTLYGKTTQFTYNGENLFDGDLERGGINIETGLPFESGSLVRSVNFIPVIGGSTIIVSNTVPDDPGGAQHYANDVYEYDENQTPIGYAGNIDEGYVVEGALKITLTDNTRYIKICSDISDIMAYPSLSVQYTIVYDVTFPSVDNPSPLESVGDKGNINVQINDDVYAVPTPNGLRGLQRNSVNTQYTDENGQRWYSDEIDFARGVYIKRIASKVLNGTESWTKVNNYFVNKLGEYGYIISSTILSTHYPKATITTAEDGVGIHCSNSDSRNQAQIQFRPYPISQMSGVTASNIKAIFSANPTTVYYALAEPVEIPLTEEQLAAFAEMRSCYPNTTVTNDENAYVSVNYIADTTAVIEKLTNAIIALGGNV